MLQNGSEFRTKLEAEISMPPLALIIRLPAVAEAEDSLSQGHADAINP